jgi:hypothetical protein
MPTTSHARALRAQAPLQLCDRSLQLLLLLTQHAPPALAPASGSASGAQRMSNPFLTAMSEVGDKQPFDDAMPRELVPAAADGADPERGQLRKSVVSFRELHDAIARLLPEQCATLLLYLLLHGNRDYLDYSLSRTDPETLLVPLLRVLHDARSLPVNQLYMLLILLLMLSQDAGFVAACQGSLLPSVPWYRDRLLGQVSVGSLMVLVLVRTVQGNLAGSHDAYVHTNCLAALANVAPLLRRLHPHAARCLLSLTDLFSRKVVKQQRSEAARKGDVDAAAALKASQPASPTVREPPTAALPPGDGTAPPAPPGDGTAPPALESGRSETADECDHGAEALQMTVDFLRIGLEALNLCLMAGPALNEHLVYALLERQHIFGAHQPWTLFGGT